MIWPATMTIEINGIATNTCTICGPKISSGHAEGASDTRFQIIMIGKIDSAVMAPALALNSGDLMTEEDKEKRDMVEKLVDHVERDFDYVGKDFANEARKIHDGEARQREIYGEATFSEAQDLLIEGVPVAPLPKPPRKKD